MGLWHCIRIRHPFLRNMNVILTNLDNPARSKTKAFTSRKYRHRRAQNLVQAGKQHSGVIAELPMEEPNPTWCAKFQNWKRQSGHFQRPSRKDFNTELNKSSAGAIDCEIESRRTAESASTLKSDTQLTNVKIADDIARELRIKPDRTKRRRTRRCRQDCSPQRR